MNERVCMLTLNHSAKDDRIFFKEAISLNNAGFEVHILCLSNNEGELLDMSGNLLNSNGEQDLLIDGIRIHSVPESDSGLASLTRRILNAPYHKSFVEKGLEINADIYHAHEPESLILGFKICSKNTKAKLVMDAHESWVNRGLKTSYALKNHIPKLKYLITANHITRGFLLSHNYKLKSEVIYNASVFKHEVNKGTSTPFRILHEGTLKFNRD